MRNFAITLTIALLGLVSVTAPDARAEGLQTFELDNYAGKVVVVDFWASWCVPCRRSFPWLNAMHAKYAGDGLVIIGVNVDTQRDEADKFLAAYPADFRIHFDTDGTLARQFGVEAMPSSFVIGRDGEIIARHLGFKVKKQDEYEATLVDALGGQP